MSPWLGDGRLALNLFDGGEYAQGKRVAIPFNVGRRRYLADVGFGFLHTRLRAGKARRHDHTRERHEGERFGGAGSLLQGRAWDADAYRPVSARRLAASVQRRDRKIFVAGQADPGPSELARLRRR